MIILARLLHMRINLLLHNLHVQYCQLVQHSQFGHPGEAQVELHDEALALAGLGLLPAPATRAPCSSS